MSRNKDKIQNFFKTETGFGILWILVSAIGITLQMLISSQYMITYDSSYQYALTAKSFPELWALIPADYSPPLYAVLLKLVNLIFGENLTIYRLFNSVALSGMVYLGLFPVRKEFGTTAGYLSAFLAVTSAVNLKRFFEIRPTYFAYFFVTGVAVYAYLAFFRKGKKNLILFTIFAVLCVYTHNIAMLAAFGIYLVCLAGSAIRKDKKQFLAFLFSGILCAVLYLPWLAVLFHQIKNVGTHYWESCSVTVELLKYFIFDGMFQVEKDLMLPVVIDLFPRIAAVLFFLCNIKINPKSDMEEFQADLKIGWAKCRSAVLKYGFLAMELIVPLIIFTIINENFHKLAAERYFNIFTGIAMLLMVLPIAKKNNKLLCIGFCLLTLVNFTNLYIPLLQNKSKLQTKQMIQDVREAHPDGDIAFLHTHEWSIGIMMYFFPDAKHYIYDDTWTVLTDMSVFPSEVINIGEPENIADYTDTVYVFDVIFPDAPTLNDNQLGKNAEEISSTGYFYNIVGIALGEETVKLREVKVSEN
ncbi:MAG: glycosyltransferase family 39 protein [Oscillospiraceae bacterium]|nr:glycosyltransferase family 39 protein [Oscillospiraceae bacterium]